MSLAYAVPKYISDHSGDIAKTPPGHRFLLYFQACNIGWRDLKEMKHDALKSVVSNGAFEGKLVDGLVARQKELAVTDSHFAICAKSTAPIATGLGNPHPVENGFAFLSPYGVPYLAGSSVKGVVRRAAEELALFEPETGWTIPLVWVLFGFEATSAYLASSGRDNDGLRWMESFANWVIENADNDKLLRIWLDTLCPVRTESDAPTITSRDILTTWIGKKGEKVRREIHWQGLVNFWDVFPETQNGLTVDILNPHHKNYYEGNGTPNDSETPKPVFFLTIPPGASCNFICETQTVAGEKRRRVLDAVGDWKALMTKAYGHAFDWLGFGAKTAVGYGAMKRDHNAERSLLEAANARNIAEEDSRRKAEWESLSEDERLIRTASLLDVTEQQIVECFNKLDSLASPVREQLAAAIRDFYVKTGKWQGGSKKQIEKVKKLKTIIGE